MRKKSLEQNNSKKPLAIPTTAPDELPDEQDTESPESTIAELKKASKQMMLWADRYYLFAKEDGTLAKVDMITGKTEELETDNLMGYTQDEFDLDKYYSFEDDEGRTILVPKGIKGTNSIVEQFRGKLTYNPVVAANIIDHVQNGAVLTKLCKRKDMPSLSILYKWRKENTKFDDLLKGAIAYRSKNFNELINEDIMNMHFNPEHYSDKKLLEVLKVKHNSIIKLNGMNTDREYDQKQQTGSQVVNIQINTGFDDKTVKSGEILDIEAINDTDLK